MTLRGCGYTLAVSIVSPNNLRQAPMQETLQALRSLQDVDRHIFKVEEELKRLPVELATRQAEVTRLKSEIDQRHKAVTDLRHNVKEIELATAGQRERKRKLEAESASGKVDAAMLASYTHEIRSVERTVDQAESDALRMVSQSDSLEKDIVEMQLRLDSEQTIFETFSANVDTETIEAQDRLTELTAKREAAGSAAGPIDATTLELYRRLLTTREGEALAELSGRICQGCFVEIPRNIAVKLAQGVDLVQCTQCKRILVPGF